MKKIFIIILSVLFLIIVIYYFKSDYKITYKVNNYKIKEQYKDNKYYFEINKDKLYNFDYLSDRKINKKHITNIKNIKDNVYECIIIKSDKIITYPLCYKEDKLISYTLVDSAKIKEFFAGNGYKIKEKEASNKKDFQFYNNLDKDEYIAIWKYNGFYILNENNIKTINLFNKDRYSNDLCYLNKEYLLLPNYNEKHEFTSFYIVNIKSGNKEKVETDYTISYESVILGSYKNNVYLKDKKYNKKYKINVKKGTVDIGSPKELNKKTSEYIYINQNNLTKTYKENQKYSTIIFNKEIKNLYEDKDDVYFVYKENLYKYNPYNGEKIIVRNFEWNFNLKDTIFIYNE